VLAIFATVAVLAGLIALFAWSPWVQPSEIGWLGTYETWSDGLEASLAAERPVSRAACEATYDDAVGSPPTERLEGAAAAARSGCAALSGTGWQAAQADVVRELMLVHGDLLPPRPRRDLSAIAHSSVGVRSDVYCWQPEAWAPFREQYALIRGGEVVSLKGIADTTRNRIDLDPAVCRILDQYQRRIRPTALSYQNFELAEALAVLTHQAEHLKDPDASEAEVECSAVQHVRPLVDEAWGARFANEIALHAWEISYLNLPPAFRTPDCRDGKALDRNPGSSVWP
jgi:hypothetical protein